MILLTQTPDDVPKWVARGCLCVSSVVVHSETRTDLLMGTAAVQLPVDATVDVLYYRCRYRVLLILTSPAHAHLTAGTCASRRGAPLKPRVVGWELQSFISPVFSLLCTVTTSSRIPGYLWPNPPCLLRAIPPLRFVGLPSLFLSWVSACSHVVNASYTSVAGQSESFKQEPMTAAVLSPSSHAPCT